MTERTHTSTLTPKDYHESLLLHEMFPERFAKPISFKEKFTGSVTVEYKRCPRCNQDHLLTMVELVNKSGPFWNPLPIIFTHWSICPITLEPFLICQFMDVWLEREEDYSI